jgi:hypothetical protein
MSDDLRALDAALARAMGWAGYPQVSSGGVPAYSTNPTAIRLAEDEIERRGLQDEYMTALFEIVFNASFEQYVNTHEIWRIIRATPEQRARAALAALNKKE